LRWDVSGEQEEHVKKKEQEQEAVAAYSVLVNLGQILCLVDQT
jgi:hypothetical protein